MMSNALMPSRGFAAVALDGPKYDSNVGGVLRAAHCYGAGLVIISGKRFKRELSDVYKTWRHVPVIEVGDVFDAIPYDCVPVAVDLVEGATPLAEYTHPQRALYVFGGEDATLGRRILDRCRDRVYVPTNGCMNLAATANVILYDRQAKNRRAEVTHE